MKKISPLLALTLAMAACSSGPGKNDLKDALNESVVKLCPYASVKNITIIQSRQPESGNKNAVFVKYSYDLTVKADDEFAEKLRTHEKAVAYERTKKVVVPQELAEKLEYIEKINFRDVKPGEEIPGIIAIPADANERMVFDLQEATLKKLKAMHKELSQQINEAHFEYLVNFAKNSNGLLKYKIHKRFDGVEEIYFEDLEQPRVPVGCGSYDTKTPYGLLTQAMSRARNHKNFVQADYLEGPTVSIEAEHEMVKTSNGWRFN